DPANGCTSTASVAVTQDTTKPNADAGAAPGPLTCTTTQVSLSGSSTTAGATFSWATSDGHIVSGATTASPTVDQAGTYTLTVTDPATGCSNSASVVVTQDLTKPNADAGAAPAPLRCTTTQVSLNR